MAISEKEYREIVRAFFCGHVYHGAHKNMMLRLRTSDGGEVLELLRMLKPKKMPRPLGVDEAGATDTGAILT